MSILDRLGIAGSVGRRILNVYSSWQIAFQKEERK